MNLFRSEEHMRNWVGFVEGTEEGIVPILDMIKLFSGPFFTRRMDPDYVSHMLEYAREMGLAFKEIGRAGPFWRRQKPQ
jgi:hypothetical protein